MEQNLRLLVALFDHIYVVDQSSTDQTTSIARTVQSEYPGRVSIYSLRQQGYFQSEVSKLIADLAFSEGADWVFFVDADEFVDVASRRELEDRLQGHEVEVVHFRWRNLLPSRFGTYGRFDIAQPYRTLAHPSEYVKVAIPVAWAARFPHFEVQLGNHAVVPWDGAKPTAGTQIGQYFHIPVRSLDRLSMKVEAGVAAYEAKSGNRKDAGEHWYQIRQMLSDGAGQVAIANMILSYGKLGVHWPSATQPLETVEERAFVDGRIACPKPQEREASTPYEVRSRDEALSWRSSPKTKGKRVARVTDSFLIQIGLQPVTGRRTIREARYGALAQGVDIGVDRHRLVEAVCAAFKPIETPVATSWGGHVPTLFFLMSLLAPRRYVELGSHYGMSFFAACQMSKEMRASCECVAIDTWEGDDHTSSYGEQVFLDFEHLLSTRYPHVGSYVRGYFDDAAETFESGSIDLLHIDGLHTYEAVRHDFETWLPKMTDRGVVLFHDTNEHRADFGVWRLWHEIEDRFPAWNSLHTHGLGIAYVGSAGAEVASLLTRLGKDPLWNEVVNELAKGIGGLAFDAAVEGTSPVSKKFIARERKIAADAAAAKTARKFQASLSWRVSAPLRMGGRLLRKALKHQ